MRPRNLPITILLLITAMSGTVRADQTLINIHADQVIQPTTKCLSGACIEDVNHEIYGGLYSQMIFGESFQEPALTPEMKGFKAYGGNWIMRDKTVEITGTDGQKLVGDHAPFANGTTSVEMLFADGKGQSAGLLVSVNKPAVGADAFTGYEISVDPGQQLVRLGRHRNNFELINDTPCEVPVGKWFSLQVKLTGSQIEISVDGKSVVQHDDGASILEAGSVGLRSWHSTASFRNLSVTIGDHQESLAFEQASSSGDISSMWRPIVHGTATAHFSLDTNRPFIGSQSQTIAFESGEGEVGITNSGLNHWGMNFVAGKPYEGYAWVRAETATSLAAALEGADGSKLYAEQLLNIPAGDWHRVDISLTPAADDTSGRFSLKLKGPGALTIGHVFLQPGSWGRFKDLPIRQDVADGLINQGVNVIRYGGSMVNSTEYRWKNMIGPRDRRPPYAGTWYRYSSNGWGVIDFLNFSEAAQVLGIPDLNINETPHDLADFIEFVNGPAETEWGKRRAADGHPAPYHLRYLELGNEERVDNVYAGKFTALADAIWKKDPDIILVVGDFGYTRKITDPDHITGADSHIPNLDGQRQILELAKTHDREVWFDVHVWSEALRPSSNLIVLPSYMNAIDQISGGARHKVVVFELNANSHGQNRALANAISINTIRRDNRIPIITSANGLQPDGQNNNGWDQGLLFLNPSQVWLQPPGYITQMQAHNESLKLLKSDVSAGSHLDVTAGESDDGKAVVLEVVNPGDAESATIDLPGFSRATSMAHITEMAAATDEVNIATEPARIHPVQSEWSLDSKAPRQTHLFPPHSFTILRFN